MARLIYVHGRGLKPPADVERRAWLDALNRGLSRLEPPARQVSDADHFQLAYWSDLFYPPGATEQQAGLTPEQRSAIQALVGKFWQWRLPQPTAPAVDPETRAFEDNFVRDAIKFFGLGYADRCAQPLRQALLDVPDGEAVMLVSHSFGTVLAYLVLVGDLSTIDVQRAQVGRQPLNIDTWVTLGSPLSWVLDLQGWVPTWKEQLIAEVDQGLQPFLGQARQWLDSIGELTRQGLAALRPPAPSLIGRSGGSGVALLNLASKQFPPHGVARWFNIYDPRDPITCAGGFSPLLGNLAVGDTFLDDAGQQRAFDVRIRNDACPAGVVGVDMRAHQDFSGYGQCAQLAQLVSDCWQRSAASW